MSKMALWLVVGGLAVDLIDAFTTKAGEKGGMLYGPDGYLKTVDAAFPMGLHPGQVIASVGAVMLFTNRG